MPYYDCPQCDDGTRYYDNKEEFYAHLNHYDHWLECETCTRQFSGRHSLRQHMNSMNHWMPKYGCETCDKKFQTSSAAEKHMRDRGHYENYCRQCDRHFNNANNLRMHLNSKIHRGQDIKCPFCRTGFVTASGASHHLETGSCRNAPSLNRESIHNIIRGADQNGMITNKQIEWNSESNSQYTVTSQAWNGDSWECYLCHKGFGSSRGLSQHLNSPIHQQKVYHCPNSRRCPKEFVSLAALFNHLESESCQFMRFEKVQQVHGQVAESLIRGGRLLAFH
ncbi:hypothetical protein N7495_005317 [Penicillium taxi]|uniref:uncharacterized protein n=1 Tax=Penicillium taxi TaxID=168475 RepID=UPI002544E4B5|nr:uncharacterized protein N7495_005317 [Penicillium taxi]KAJ5893626.1 hypothetical protein N7495_005317 [Penicillium taxi]